MTDIQLKIIFTPKEAKEELLKIGVDERSLPMMAPKMEHFVFKLKGVDCRAANILKQEMLSKGGEAALAKWSSGFKKPTTDVLLMANLKQYRLVLKKLAMQPYGLTEIGQKINEALRSVRRPKRAVWNCRGRKLIVGKRTLVMGILNVTPDSFSDSGRYYHRDQAVSRALEMEEEGADIIDIGGESTRPGSKPVSAIEEGQRVLPVIKRLVNKVKVPISIDTQKAEVARQALEEGAGIVNDISALRFDPQMVEVVVEYQTPLVLMHMQGRPETMQQAPRYADLMGEIGSFLKDRAQFAINSGVSSNNIAIDPGFGFGKTVSHNLEMLRRLSELKLLGYPILVGSSRKSTIGAVLDLPVEDRLEGTAATVAIAVINGADIVRVHDVKAMARVVKMTDAICQGETWRG